MGVSHGDSCKILWLDDILEIPNIDQNLSLGEAASRFLATLSQVDRGASQQELFKFIRWVGWDRPLAGLAAFDVSKYNTQLSSSDTQKVGVIKGFLTYAKKQGWSGTNLATHIKIKKGQTKFRPSSNQDLPKTVSLSRQGYTRLEAELAILKTKRLQAIVEISKAAADKDFSENAPLDAAREQRQHLERMISEIENALDSAVNIEEKQKGTFEVDIGISIILHDLDSGEELHYMIVNPKEIEPVNGKISSSSPIGQAIIGRGRGEIVEVETPTGKLRYQIKDVIRPQTWCRVDHLLRL